MKSKVSFKVINCEWGLTLIGSCRILGKLSEYPSKIYRNSLGNPQMAPVWYLDRKLQKAMYFIKWQNVCYVKITSFLDKRNHIFLLLIFLNKWEKQILRTDYLEKAQVSKFVILNLMHIIRVLYIIWTLKNKQNIR